MIFVIDSDEVMAKCIKKTCGPDTLVFNNAIDAMAELENGLPDLIILDVMLIGPDGFSFLNELISYEDTAKIPIVLVSELDLGQVDLSTYGVVEFFNKDALKPSDIKNCVRKFVRN